LVGKWEGAHWPLGFRNGRRPRQLAPKLGHLVVCRALATLTEPLTSGNFISRTEIFNYFSFGEYGFYFAFFEQHASYVSQQAYLKKANFGR